MTDRETQIAKLADRLEDGWQRIEAAERKGQETGKWTDFWLGLLKEYETLCEAVEEAAEAREQVALL